MNLVKREDYGRRLEPYGHAILHGAGQSQEEFASYCNTMNPMKPIIYMTYFGLKGNAALFFQKLEANLHSIGMDEAILQIGLSMTKDGSPEMHYEHEVAAGVYDEQIATFCRELKKWGRPVFIRLGYECNGHWNGYEPDSYIKAWRRFSDALQICGVRNAALVWCCSADGSNKDFMSLYPGDSYVDWWSIDCFAAEHFTNPDVLLFMDQARKHRYPVMIGECTPRRVGVLQGEDSWNRWFAPYFEFLATQPGIKASCYISWDWSGYPQWSDWGNGRISDNDDVRQRYREAMSTPAFIHYK